MTIDVKLTDECRVRNRSSHGVDNGTTPINRHCAGPASSIIKHNKKPKDMRLDSSSSSSSSSKNNLILKLILMKQSPDATITTAKATTTSYGRELASNPSAIGDARSSVPPSTLQTNLQPKRQLSPRSMVLPSSPSSDVVSVSTQLSPSFSVSGPLLTSEHSAIDQRTKATLRKWKRVEQFSSTPLDNTTSTTKKNDTGIMSCNSDHEQDSKHRLDLSYDNNDNENDGDNAPSSTPTTTTTRATIAMEPSTISERTTKCDDDNDNSSSSSISRRGHRHRHRHRRRSCDHHYTVSSNPDRFHGTALFGAFGIDEDDIAYRTVPSVMLDSMISSFDYVVAFVVVFWILHLTVNSSSTTSSVPPSTTML